MIFHHVSELMRLDGAQMSGSVYDDIGYLVASTCDYMECRAVATAFNLLYCSWTDGAAFIGNWGDLLLSSSCSTRVARASFI